MPNRIKKNSFSFVVAVLSYTIANFLGTNQQKNFLKIKKLIKAFFFCF
jgi:hypothetical protein